MTTIPVRRALISVSDKQGLLDFARRLVAAGVEIVSSGGTARALETEKIPVEVVSSVTGAPEILGGRVKTLHPRIHGGILADPNRAEHRADLEAEGIDTFQLVVVNLYPFEQTVADPTVDLAAAVEQIDIGGPAMIRAAAKNHAAVGVVVDPSRYDEVAVAVEAGGLDAALRSRLAREAFFRTAAYDAAIVAYLERGEELPERVVVPLRRRAGLRYGENPHQAAAAYREDEGWWTEAVQLQGKDLSFNNLADAEAAWRLVHDLRAPAAVVLKHTNACGAAERTDLAAAFDAAWEGDPQAGFGGIVAVNQPLDGATAEQVAGHFVEVVIAPVVTAEARESLARKTNLRVIEAPPPGRSGLDLRRLDGGFLIQERDEVESDPTGWKHVAGPAPGPAAEDLRIAWVLAAHTKSNAIVLVRDRAAVGVGGGDQSRVGAARRAVAKAGQRARGAVAASDAFFPFRDGLDALADAGVTAVVEPGGSRRDDEVIAAADERGVSLLFTGRRHFRH